MKNTLRFIKQGSTKIKLAQTFLSFCVLSLLATTNLFAQSTDVLDYTSVPGTNNVNDYTITAALSTSTNFTIDWGNGDQGPDTYTSSLIRVIGGAAIAPVDGGTLGNMDDMVFNASSRGFQLTADNSFSIDVLNLYRRADSSELRTENFTVTGYKNGNQTITATLTWVQALESNTTEVFTRGAGTWDANPAWDDIDKLVVSYPDPAESGYQEIAVIDMTVSDPTASNSAPTVTTSAASSITATGATLSGNVTDDGGDPVTERGFVYATSPNPTTADTQVQDGSGTGAFEEDITGLTAETTYYVRAYAINSEGTSYGSEESFMTSASQLENFSWSADNLEVGATGVTYTFSYTTITEVGASPEKILYIGNTGWNLSEEENDISVAINGTPATVSSTFFPTVNYVSIALDSSVPGGSDVKVTVRNVTNNTTADSYAWNFIMTALGSGHAIDEAASPDPIVLMESNSAPTDITLNATTVNQNDGENATVGTLSTTDIDGDDTHSYSLVAGTGDDDNGSFNINGTDLRATDASALAAGEHSVRIQTDDGNDTFAKAFTITVADDMAPSFQNSTPSLSGTTGSQTTLTVRLDETGAAYYVLVEDEDGAPGSAQVKAGQNSEGTAALFSGSINVSSALQDFTDDITGLSSGTEYDVYVVAEDDEGSPNLQVSPTKVDVSTPNAAPTASNVSISGTFTYDEELTGSYDYTDAENDDESGTTLQWYRSDDATGTNRSAITDSTNSTYTPGKDDIGKYINFEVTPNDGNAFGSAVETDFSGPVASPFAGGEGTEASPYEIATTLQLDYVRDFLDNYFKQAADIDLDVAPYNEGSGWDPIGDEGSGMDPIGDQGSTFTGSFDGNGHSISNLTINRSGENYIGLFGHVEGNLQSVAIVNADVTGQGRVGILAGYVTGDVNQSYSTGSVIADNNVGGLIGYLPSGSSLTSSYTISDVTFSSSAGGGLVGVMQGDDITNSYAVGTINGPDNNKGGLVGYEEGNIINSFYNEETSGQTDDKGVPISTLEMKTKSTFTETGWDFDTVWQIDEPQNGSISYPYLQSIPQDPAPGYEIINLPVASNVTISGSLIYDQELIGDYDFSDADGDTEGATTFQWYRSDDENGNGRSSITGATTTTYFLTKDDIGKYISFEVIPNDGIYDGDAAETAIEGPVASPFAGGEGTEAGPYEIATAEQLDYVRDFLDNYFQQTADIDLGVSPWNDGSGWEPIGTDTDTFTGALDGNGHTISNLFIDRVAGYAGLFGYIGEGSQVTSIFIKNANVTSTETRVGILAGYLAGDISEIEVSGTVSGNGRVGGLAGATELSSTITNVSVDITIISTDQRVGGLLGSNRGDISNSYAYGSVSGSDRVGGLVGNNHSGAVSNNYVAVELNGGSWIGGLVGDNAGGTYSDNYMDEDVANTSSSGNGTFQSTEEMKTKSTFTDAGWDFDTVWQIDEPQNGSISYPYLQSNTQDPVPGYLEVNAPTVITDANITNITSDSVDISGDVTNDGSLEVTKRGFTWATVANPSDTTIVWVNSGMGSFSATVTDLPPGTELTIRAIAVNLADSAYGDPVSFETEKGELLVNGSFTAAGKEYDGDPSAEFDQNSLGLDGIYSGHDVQFGDITLEFDDTNAGEDKEVTLQSAILARDDAGKYTVSLTNAPTAVADITHRPITVTADAQQVIYGDADPALSYEITTGSLVTGEELSGDLDRVAGLDVGTFAIQQGDLTAGSNYDLSFVEAHFEITPRELTVTTDADQTKIYGETDPVFTFEATNFGWNDNETLLTGSLDRAAGETVGTYPIGLGDLSANSNYTIDYTGADFTISGKELTITADAGQSKIYGENDPAFTFTVSGFESGDEEAILTGSLSREAGDDVGKYELVINNLSAGDNYSITLKTDSLDITPKTLTVTADPDQGKTYGQTDPAFTFTADGFEFSDNESEFTGSLGRASGEDVGSYGITKGDLSAGDNYSINYSGADFVITPAMLSVTADADQSKVYGEDDPDLIFTAKGFERTDGESEISGTLVRTTGEDAGIYTISAGDLDAGANYTIDYTEADFEITPKTLKIVAEADQNKDYGESDPHLTYQVDGFVFNDDESIITGIPEREAGEKADLYTITQGDVDAGENYIIDFTGANFTITAKELTVVASEDQEKNYGEDDPESFSYSVTNFSHGDDESLLTGSLSRISGEDARSYKITEGDLSAGDNYSIDFRSADFVIHEAELLITADSDQSKVYGDEDPDYGWSVNGFRFNDDEQIINGDIAREEGESTGSYDLKRGTLNAGDNYVINFEPAVFGITPKTLVVSADEEIWKFEGDIDPDLTFTASGFAFDDDENLFEGALSRESGEQPGEYAITAGNFSAAQNYDIEFETEIFSILRTPPVVEQRSPAAGENRIATDEPVIVEFDHDITIADSELISLKGPKNSAIEYQAETDGNKLTLTHNGFNHHTTYSVTLSDGGVRNEDGIGNEAAEWSFTTIMPAPLAENPSPADGDTQVDVEQPIEISFNQEVTEADFSGISISSDDDSPAELAFELEKNRLTISHSGLDHLTDYTVTVPGNSVHNEDGVGNETYSWSFKTIIAVPEQVELTTPFDMEGAVALNPSLEWNPSAHAETYHIQISGTETFDELLRNEDELTGLFIEPEELFSDYRTYFWRVRASNDAGSSDWSDVHRFTTLANTPGEIFPLKNSEEISTAPALEWDSDYETTYRVQLSDSEIFVSLLSDTLAEQKTLQVTGLEADFVYYWRVRVESEETSSDWSEPVRFSTRPAPSTEDENQVVEQDIEFGDTSNREERVISELDYRMVGLPGNDHHGVEDFFEGKYGREWKVFYENGGDTEYYDEYEPDDDRFVFAPGRGFWVLSTEIMDLELNINSVATNERDAYSIPLHPGWNIITNPHRGPVSWSDVQEMNGFNGDAWGYDQRFVPADTLQPVQGYYVYNHPGQPREQLDIPYATMEQRRSEQVGNALMASKSNVVMPSVNLSAQFEEFGQFDTQILYPDLAGTQDDGDELNEEALRRYYPSLEMSRSGMMLVNEEHLARGGLLREVSRFDSDGTEYELHLKGETGQRFNWRLNLQQMPEQTRALVVNRVNNKTWLLKHGEEVEATLTEPNAVYDLYTGDRDRLEQLRNELMPQEFALEPNYPNPFNPVTNIRYSLPDQQHVKLEVYDVIGRRVQVLTNDVQQAGWHVVQFDGRRLASGVYLYRLTTENNVKVRKMTLVK